jgi:hypothetical protein
MIAFIRLKGFYVREFLRLQLENGNSSPFPDGLLVVRDKQILDFSPHEEFAKLRVGMSESDARALFPQMAVLTEKAFPGDSVELLPGQREWLQVVFKYSSVVEPVDRHVAFADFSAHPRPLDLIEQMREEIVALGVDCSVGVAPCRWVAESCCEAPFAIAARDPAGFVFDLSVLQLLPLSDEAQKRLLFLGYRRAGDLLKVRPEVLKKQFGNEVYTILQTVRGEGDSLVRAIFPPGVVVHDVGVGHVVETSEMWEALLRSCTDHLSTILQNRSLTGQALEVELLYESGERVSFCRTFQKHLQTPRSVLVGILLTLGLTGKSANAEALAQQEISRIRVTIGSLHPARVVQKDLGQMVSRGAQKDSLENSLAMVRKQFGDKCVIAAKEKHEPRRKMVLRVWRETTGWR